MRPQSQFAKKPASLFSSVNSILPQLICMGYTPQVWQFLPRYSPTDKGELEGVYQLTR